MMTARLLAGLLGGVLFVCASPALAVGVNVFFAGGQSNAKATWATSISNTLQATGAYQSPVVVHATHPGDWLNFWYDGGPQANYLADFYNPAGTGALQTSLQAIFDAGNTPVFTGFFWFQGEGDTGAQASIDSYSNRFLTMLSQLHADIHGAPGAVPFTLAVIDADPSFDMPAGRTREQIDSLRQVQIDLAGNSPGGSYVDTRGYQRTDEWHLTTAELDRLGVEMANTFVAANPVPLPAALPLFLAALAGLALAAHRGKSAASQAPHCN